MSRTVERLGRGTFGHPGPAVSAVAGSSVRGSPGRLGSMLGERRSVAGGTGSSRGVTPARTECGCRTGAAPRPGVCRSPPTRPPLPPRLPSPVCRLPSARPVRPVGQTRPGLVGGQGRPVWSRVDARAAALAKQMADECMAGGSSLRATHCRPPRTRCVCVTSLCLCVYKQARQ